MSVRLPSGGARRDDDEFLDRIGRGEQVDGGEVERLLSQWRASMPTAGPTDDRLLDAVTAAIARPTQGHVRLRRATATVAAAFLLIGGAVTAAAAQAGPDSPLWPVTELVFGGLAESRVAAERADGALRDARTAVDQGRIPEATRLLAHADHLADKVDEPDAAERIRDDVAALRERLSPNLAKAPPQPGTTERPGALSPSESSDVAPTTGPTSDQPSSTSQTSPTRDKPFDRPSIDTPSPTSSSPTRANRSGPPSDDDPRDGSEGENGGKQRG